jgi:NADH dehydrogenase FAD-containing subunit
MRIVVVGGGIAGVEAVLALAATLPGARIVLLTRSPVLRILPNLVYVPFGVPAEQVDIDLEATLAGHDHCEVTYGSVSEVDADRRVVVLTDGRRIPWDALVAAPGTIPDPTSGRRLRSLADAEELRDELEVLAAAPWASDVVIRVLPDSSWSAPAYELAFLADVWLRAVDRREEVDLVVVTDEREPFELLGPEPVQAVDDELSMRSIEVMRGMQPQRIEMIDGDLVVDVGGLDAARIRGIPGRSSSGFYETDDSCRVARDVYVVGDAAGFPIKAGFATAWQARRVAHALGGDMDRLGEETDGIPHDELEYQMDLGGSTLAVRLHAESFMVGTGLRPARVELRHGPPDKLRGTLLRDQLFGAGIRSRVADRYRRIIDTRTHLADIMRRPPRS